MMEKLDLKRLSQVFAEAPDPKSEEREKLAPGYYAHWCSFKCAKFQLALQDAVVLVHGPQGCVGNERVFLSSYISQYFGSPFQHSPTTDLRQSDVILGASDKLQDAILEVDKIYRPRLIFLMVTCCAGITKEPVEEVAESLQGQVKAKIVVMRAEGFKHYCSGWVRPYLSHVVAHLMQAPEKKIAKSVNILGVSKEVHAKGRFPSDSHEMERLLERLGLTVHSVLLQGSTYDDIRKAPEAEYNVLDCPEWGMPYADRMKREWGVPHGKRYLPVGVQAISNWLIEVAEFFGLEEKARQVIDEEYSRIAPLWEEARKILQGKVALLDGGDPMSAIGRPLVWGKMCEVELGMRPILFNTPPIEIKSNEQHVNLALGEGFDPEVVYYHHPYHRRLSPTDVLESLGLTVDDVGLYAGDVYPTVESEWREPVFDPSNAPRVVMATHCNRDRGAPGRRVGFRGAERFAMDVIQANSMARRKDRPTLQGRLVKL